MKAVDLPYVWLNIRMNENARIYPGKYGREAMQIAGINDLCPIC